MDKSDYIQKVKQHLAEGPYRQIDNADITSIMNKSKAEVGKHLRSVINHLGQVSLYQRSLGKKYKTFDNRKAKMPWGQTMHFEEQKFTFFYKIKCSDCIKVYIGQTARELHSRIGEHKRKINKPPRNADEYRELSKDSAIAEHALDTGHKIDLENVEVLRRGLRSTSQRLMAEAVEIAKHPSVNRIEGAELARVWRTVLDQSS
ncbi:hypothetical protein CLF_109602 [Clonorchis sinensis]|uniref:C2H2-type domain-containing protein n=1 Tax=Clonorchis sinensis TaxID=79923 RepID=G7YSS4_CLOSI|nr:hypothetical protein CLF_109602 [Clonorchis sinensis]